MPFCIIFLTLCIVYISVFGLRNKTIDFAIIAICLGLISSLFFGDCKIGEGIVVNIPFVASIVVALMVLASQVSLFNFFAIIAMQFVIAGAYLMLVRNNIFLSIDYSIWTTIVLTILPCILYSGKIYLQLFYIYISSLTIMMIEWYFWLGEIDFAKLNIFNFVTYICTLAIFSIATTVIVALFKKSPRRVKQ